MRPVSARYDDVRDRMQPGDVLAFGGKGYVSELIKWVTRAPVSHVGVVLQTRLVEAEGGGYYNQLIESTTLDGFCGVVISRLSRRLAQYDGEVWWLPLAPDVRARLDARRMIDWLLNQDGRPYDAPQALLAGLDRLEPLTRAREDFAAFFCSELVAGALEVGGAVGPLNASEVTPIDLCRLAIYDAPCVQLAGVPRSIPGWNTVSPAIVERAA